jgi:triacylglycerol esterase/lipase EstA (alpha/beta hydrolase family)
VFANLAPARRRLVVGVLAAVVVAVVAFAVVILRPGSADTSGGAVDQARPGPVLLVPGYGGSTGSLRTLARKLEAAGRDAIVIELSGDGTGVLAASADVLGAAAQDAMASTGATSVDVVGYSAGGIVARLWVADGGAGIARRVVTLGSPNHGTRLADLAGNLSIDACPAACRQLATDSDVLRRLNAGDETPDGPTWVSIWTIQDETVTPPDTARLDGAINVPIQSVCPDARVGHSDLPSTPLVQAMVLAELLAGPPVALTSADCARLQQD